MKRSLFALTLLSLLTAAWSGNALEVSGCYGDHMVLQQNKPIVITGRSSVPGAEITAEFAGMKTTATSDGQNSWEIVFPARSAAGPLTLTLREGNGETRQFEDVWIGEVWLASGQSNMALALADTENGTREAAEADHPLIRFFQVPERMERQPVESPVGHWEICTPESAAKFSALGYYFACRIQQELGVAVGIINASRGGTGIESWMDVNSLQSVTGKGYSALASGTEPLTGEPDVTVLYNGMIHPWTNYPLRGILWYQGEANAYRNHREYALLAAAMLQSWRAAWQQPDLGFLFVQLAAFRGHDPERRFSAEELAAPDPNDCGIWGPFRPIQAELLVFPYAGMATAIDLGDPYDIHPRRKRELAERLAGEAMRVIYGRRELITRGPCPKIAIKDGGTVRILFETAGSPLKSQDGKMLRHFAVAGSDGVFHRAMVEIEGADELRIHSEAVPEPVTVRYAVSDYPGEMNFYNENNLPAVPFQLDVQ